VHPSVVQPVDQPRYLLSYPGFIFELSLLTTGSHSVFNVICGSHSGNSEELNLLISCLVYFCA
jgi:hypothetical protein